MGRRFCYTPGSFYRIDDRSGFRVPAERTRMEWNGLMVREQSWEPRQPQDFVHGTVDDQTVPYPRTRPAPQFIPIAVTSLTADAGGWTTDGIGVYIIGDMTIGEGAYTPGSLGNTISVESDSGWYVGDVLWIMQDEGIYFKTEVMAINGLTVSIFPSIVLLASAGNNVINMSAQARLVDSAYPGMIGNFTIGLDEIGVTSLDQFGPEWQPYPESQIAPPGGDFSYDFSSDFSR